MADAVVALLDLDAVHAEAFETHLCAAGFSVLRVSKTSDWDARADCAIASAARGESDRMLLERAKVRRIPMIFLLPPEAGPADTLALLGERAADVLVPPVPGLRVLAAVHRALDAGRLIRRVGRLEGELGRLRGAGQGLLGISEAMGRVRSQIANAVRGTGPILLLGETGVGKELAAREIHRLAGVGASRGARTPLGAFVAVNVAAIPSELFESELFGHEPGAFTGAIGTKRGLFESAAGGTLFLDEIGDLAPSSQARLLRSLDQGRVRRVGGVRETQVRCRVVAATNRVLARLVEEKSFRSDLYYRLAGHVIEIPPLRDRPEDILPLAEWFLAEAAERMNRPIPPISPALQERLRRHPWPGNGREIRHAMERLALYGPEEGGENGLLPEAHSPVDADAAGDYEAARRRAISNFDRSFLRRILEECGGNVSEAARRAGVDRKTFQTRMGINQVGK